MDGSGHYQITILTITVLVLFVLLSTSRLYTEQQEPITLHTLTQDIQNIRKQLSHEGYQRNKESYFLVIGIPTMPKNGYVRRTIRATWANISRWRDLEGVEEEYKKVKLMFICGHMRGPNNTVLHFDPEFVEEVAREGDIYIADLMEHRAVLKYKNLWNFRRTTQLFNFSYYLKTDDDIVVNLPLLIRHLIRSPRENWYTGSCRMYYGGFCCIERYRYCSGAGYVLTQDLVRRFNDLEPEIHNIRFRPEDAYTGYMVKVLQQQGVNVTLKSSANALSIRKYECGLVNKWFYHGCRKPRDMISHFHLINDNKSVEC